MIAMKNGSNFNGMKKRQQISRNITIEMQRNIRIILYPVEFPPIPIHSSIQPPIIRIVHTDMTHLKAVQRKSIYTSHPHFLRWTRYKRWKLKNTWNTFNHNVLLKIALFITHLLQALYPDLTRAHTHKTHFACSPVSFVLFVLILRAILSIFPYFPLWYFEVTQMILYKINDQFVGIESI